MNFGGKSAAWPSYCSLPIFFKAPQASGWTFTVVEYANYHTPLAEPSICTRSRLYTIAYWEIGNYVFWRCRIVSEDIFLFFIFYQVAFSLSIVWTRPNTRGSKRRSLYLALRSVEMLLDLFPSLNEVCSRINVSDICVIPLEKRDLYRYDSPLEILRLPDVLFAVKLARDAVDDAVSHTQRLPFVDSAARACYYRKTKGEI